MSIVRIKLKTGLREIEIEGTRPDVDELLQNWWSVEEAKPHYEEEIAFPKNDMGPSFETGQTNVQDNGDQPFDANDTVNQIKQLSAFSAIERKIILARGENYQKIALVLWISGSPLTSGQIHRALEALGIRISLPGVSNVLKTNIGKFLTSAQRRPGGSPATYRLTAHARADFESWLADDG